MFSGGIEREQWHEIGLMYQLFFRTANLLLLMYPLLFISAEKGICGVETCFMFEVF